MNCRDLLSCLRQRALETPDSIMVTFDDGALTYQGALSLAMGWAAAFRFSGADPGGAVLIAMQNKCDLAGALFGAQIAGLAPALSPPVHKAAKLEEAYSFLSRRSSRIGSNIIAVDRAEDLSSISSDKHILDGSMTPSGNQELHLDPHPSDIGLIQFTSGTSGSSKAVCLTNEALIYQAMQLNAHLCVDPSVDHALTWLPLYHDMGLFGFLFAPLFSGTQTTVLRTEAFSRNPLAWFQSISTSRATITAAPPTGYSIAARFANRRPNKVGDLSSLRVALVGAEIIDAAEMAEVANRLAPFGFSSASLVAAYGMAEVGVAATIGTLSKGLQTTQIGSLKDRPREVVKCGKPICGTEIAIFQGHDRMNEGEIGRIAIKSPSHLAHYMCGDELGQPSYVSDWLITGDKGLLTAGEVVVLGREDDVVVSGGANFLPEDVEAIVVKACEPEVLAAVLVQCRWNDTERVGVGLALHTIELDTRSRDEIRLRVLRQLSRLGLSIDRVAFIEDGKPLRTSNGKRSRAAYRELLSNGEA